jgi:uncharacterized protein (TIGR02246 family)
MNRLNVAVAAVVAACVIFVAACGGSSPEADQAAIGEANKKWLAAIAAKDVAAIGAVYAEDASMLPPNAPKVAGREAIQANWTQMVAAPGFALTFETEKLEVAKSGDVAVDIGTYSFTPSEGVPAESGKYVVTWVKRDGNWVVFTDMFSANQPAPPPAPAAPAVDAVPDAALGAPGTTPVPTDGTTPAPATAPVPTQPAPAQPAPVPAPGTP